MKVGQSGASISFPRSFPAPRSSNEACKPDKKALARSLDLFIHVQSVNSSNVSCERDLVRVFTTRFNELNNQARMTIA
jgi:hypothetical protein